MPLTHLDLFSGIGGFALAARWAGIETVQFVEKSPFCQKVLQKNFPGVPIHDDIKTFTNTNCDRCDRKEISIQSWQSQQKSDVPARHPGHPFLITGGFPCQPFSCAGQRKGNSDDRYLWPEMLRVVKEFMPTWAIGENVNGITNMVLTDSGIEMDEEGVEEQTGERTNVLVRCITDLESIGYEVQIFCIPACAVGAPHRRDRVWIVAHDKSAKCQHSELTWDRRFGLTDDHCLASDTGIKGLQGGKLSNSLHSYGNGKETHGPITECHSAWNEPWPDVAARLCRMDDGIPDELDIVGSRDNRVARIKALGNAIVPQVAYEIMKAIVYLEEGKL